MIRALKTFHFGEEYDAKELNDMMTIIVACKSYYPTLTAQTAFLFFLTV